MPSKPHPVKQYPNKKGSTSAPSGFPLNEPYDVSHDNAPTKGKGGRIPHTTRQYGKGEKS